jgi:hypothetical protein
MPAKSRAERTAANRRWRHRRALAAGRVPGRTGRPPTGRKAPKCKGDVRSQRARARERLRQRHGDNGWTETSHPIMDEAMDVASRYAKPDRGVLIFDDLWEEAMCVAALAICAGDDPDKETAAFVKDQRQWRQRVCQILFELHDPDNPAM